MQYDISPACLSSKAGDEESAFSPVFRKKLLDIAVLYEGFLSEIAGKYTVGDELLSLLTEVLDLSEMAGGENEAVFFFDGFTGFTPLQYRIQSVHESTAQLRMHVCIRLIKKIQVIWLVLQTVCFTVFAYCKLYTVFLNAAENLSKLILS